MGTFMITYRIKYGEGLVYVIALEIDANTLDFLSPVPGICPDWTSLEYEKCPNCPLSNGACANCPLAEKISLLTDISEQLLSYDEIMVEVETPDRTVVKQTTAQKAFSSLMGLLIPISGCPLTCFLRPMVRFHLPFASEEETIYRSTSMYLLAQYYRLLNGEQPDFELEGLKQHYHNLHHINRCLANRMRGKTSKDSSINALVILDLFTSSVPMVIDDTLQDIRYLFAPYLVPQEGSAS
mgnify:CR=1 FL=1